MESMKFAYIRVSTKSQSYARQLELLKERVAEIEPENIFCEKQSGATIDKRGELKRLLSVLREGDIVYVHSIDRLGRNLLDILNIVKILDEKKVRLISLSQNIDSFTPTGKMFIMICGMMAEIELILMKERILSIVETEILDDYIEGRKTVSSCMELLKISRATFFRRLQEYKDSGAIKVNKGLKEENKME